MTDDICTRARDLYDTVMPEAERTAQLAGLVPELFITVESERREVKKLNMVITKMREIIDEYRDGSLDDERCPRSKRENGKHFFRFDRGDAYIACAYCGQPRSMSGCSRTTRNGGER